jgi:nucleotide-binding universal stress UspA family protein
MEALRFALSLAQEADANLTVAHVMAHGLEDTPDLYETLIADARLSAADYERRREQSALERLNGAVPQGARAYCTIETVVTTGRPAAAILQMAAERETDLIVMGVQGRHAPDLAFFGSTTNRVVHEATCAVLTLRSR